MPSGWDRLNHVQWSYNNLLFHGETLKLATPLLSFTPAGTVFGEKSQCQQLFILKVIKIALIKLEVDQVRSLGGLH